MSIRNENEKIDYKNFRFEFLLSINGHIICQRLFDVRNYNKEVLQSLDIKWLVDDCVIVIEEDLKEKSNDELWKYFNPYVEQTQEDINKGKNNHDKKHYFNFEIRVDRKTVIKRQFDGSVYSPNTRYQVNIKDIIGELINEIRTVFSQKRFVGVYEEVEI